MREPSSVSWDSVNAAVRRKGGSTSITKIAISRITHSRILRSCAIAATCRSTRVAKRLAGTHITGSVRRTQIDPTRAIGSKNSSHRPEDLDQVGDVGLRRRLEAEGAAPGAAVRADASDRRRPDRLAFGRDAAGLGFPAPVHALGPVAEAHLSRHGLLGPRMRAARIIPAPDRRRQAVVPEAPVGRAGTDHVHGLGGQRREYRAGIADENADAHAGPPLSAAACTSRTASRHSSHGIRSPSRLSAFSATPSRGVRAGKRACARK
jgi:hypothetical protein